MDESVILRFKKTKQTITNIVNKYLRNHTDTGTEANTRAHEIQRFITRVFYLHGLKHHFFF